MHHQSSDFPSEYGGYKVINGDETDLRFIDEDNVIVGLKYKLVTGKGTKGQNKDNIENKINMKKSKGPIDFNPTLNII